MTRSKQHEVATSARTHGEMRRVAKWLVPACLLVFSSVGCNSLSMFRPEPTDEYYEKATNTDSILGPMARLVQNSLKAQEPDPIASPEITQALANASGLFDAGKYAEAAPIYKDLAKSQKLTAFGEEARFKLAECYYHQQNFAKAQDAYDQLLEDHPTTRHVDAITRRLFTIAQAWLGLSVPLAEEPKDSGIQLVSNEEIAEPQEPARLNIDTSDPTYVVPLLPNFHDRRRPLFDTQGRALQALKSIWLNDPTGPLADDALMLTATHYMKKKDFVEADRYYKILREEYPKSPHLEKAFVLGSHVKLMSYRGPFYEGNTLKDARKLKESTLRMFPDNPQRKELQQELRDIYNAEAERLWARIEYEQRKKRPRAIAIACRTLIDSFPETEYAQKARKVLADIPRDKIADLPGFQ